MKTLTKDIAISFGGKVWEKNDISRVYMNIDALNNFLASIGWASNLVPVTAKTKAAKTYVDCASGCVYSDVGAVRVILNQCGVKCEK